MPDCILHFGLPKTGSTAIQRALSRHLTDPRFLYSRFQEPIHDHGNHSRAIVTLFSHRAEAYHTHAAEGVSRERLAEDRLVLRARLDAEVAALAGRTLLLSAEDILYLRPKELESLRRFLEERRLATLAVGYVRPPRAALESQFLEALKHRAPSLTSFLGIHRSFGMRRLASLDQAFGREHVRIWKYDRGAFPGHCVVADFCRRIDARTPQVIENDANRSFSLAAARLLYTWRRHVAPRPPDPQAPGDDAAFIARLGDLTGPRFRFHPSLIEPIISQYPIDRLEERVGGSLRDGMDDDQAPAIRGEEDLFDFSPESLDWLARQTGVAAATLAGGDRQVVAGAVDRLREIAVAQRRLAERAPTGLVARVRELGSRIARGLSGRSP